MAGRGDLAPLRGEGRRDPTGGSPAGAVTAHPFGTDDLGRDLAARVAVATPISLAIGLVAAAVSLFVGFGIGGAAGYFGGVTDLLLSRLIEVVLCFPVLFLLLALAAFLPPSPATVVLAIGLTTWPSDARSSGKRSQAKSSTTPGREARGAADRIWSATSPNPAPCWCPASSLVGDSAEAHCVRGVGLPLRRVWGGSVVGPGLHQEAGGSRSFGVALFPRVAI